MKRPDSCIERIYALTKRVERPSAILSAAMTVLGAVMLIGGAFSASAHDPIAAPALFVVGAIVLSLVKTASSTLTTYRRNAAAPEMAKLMREYMGIDDPSTDVPF